MASKMTYWKCVDCSSMINDENMHELHDEFGSQWKPLYAEFCYGCMSYNPEVVISYD